MLAVAALALLAGIVLAILTAPGSNEGAPSTPSARGRAIRHGGGSSDLAGIHRYAGVSVGPVDRATAARYLGLTIAEIRTALRSGRSLAQTASSTRGRSAAGLIEALIHAKTAALASAVRAGKLTTAAQRASITTLPRRVSAEVYFRRPAAP